MASGSSIFLLVSERHTEVAEELLRDGYSVKGGYLGQEERLRGPALFPNYTTLLLLPWGDGGVVRHPVLEEGSIGGHCIRLV